MSAEIALLHTFQTTTQIAGCAAIAGGAVMFLVGRFSLSGSAAIVGGGVLIANSGNLASRMLGVPLPPVTAPAVPYGPSVASGFEAFGAAVIAGVNSAVHFALAGLIFVGDVILTAFQGALIAAPLATAAYLLYRRWTREDPAAVATAAAIMAQIEAKPAAPLSIAPFIAAADRHAHRPEVVDAKRRIAEAVALATAEIEAYAAFDASAADVRRRALVSYVARCNDSLTRMLGVLSPKAKTFPPAVATALEIAAHEADRITADIHDAGADQAATIAKIFNDRSEERGL